MADQAEILAELGRRREAGQFSERQQAAWAELERRQVITTQSVPGKREFSQEFEFLNTLTDPEQGVPEFETAEGLQNLRNTGVTPANAVRFASLDLERRRRRGEQVNPRQQEAIFDMYKQMAGRNDLSSQNFYQDARQRQIDARSETVGGRFLDFGAGINQSLGGTGASLVGAVNPDLGQELQEGVNAEFATRQGSRASALGNLSGEAAKIAATLPAGAVGMGGIYGAQGFGGQRNEVERLRNEGRDISAGQEFGSAGAVGAVEGVSGYVGARVFGALGNVFKSLGPGARASLQSGEQSAVRAVVQQALRATGATTGAAIAEGSEEAATQYVTNLIKQGVNPEQALHEGLTQSFIFGAALSPVGGGLSATYQQGGNVQTAQQQAQDARATPQQTTAPEQTQTLLGLPTAEDIAVRQLGDAEANLAAEQAALADPVQGEGTIVVDPEGRAYTPEQQQNVILDPARQLPPGQQARFVAEEGGQVRDLQPQNPSPQLPEADHRSQKTSDAVTEEADMLIADMRKKGQDLDPATEQRVRKLVDDARRNPLTGGMNRAAFQKVFDAVRTRARKTGKPVSVISLDAANLKTYNDKKSESAGDEYLKRVQQVVASALRTSRDGGEHDRIGDAFHYGGDEWAVVLPDTDEAGAKIVRDRIEEAFGREEIVPGVSAFLVGESTTIAPNSRRQLRSVLDDAAKGMKTRKAKMKSDLGEATTREGAEAAAAQAEQGATPPVPSFRRTQAVRDAAAEVGRRRQALAEVRASAKVAHASAAKATPIEGTDHASHKRRVYRSVEAIITPLTSRIQDMSKAIYNRLMTMEFDTNTARERLKKELNDPAKKITKDLGGKKSTRYRQWKLAVLNGERDAATDMLSPDVRPEMAKFYGTFRSLLANMQDAGVTIGDLGDTYWSRFIKDYKGFQKLFGDGERGRFEEAWDIARAVKGRAVLTADEKAEIANSVIAGFGPRKPGTMGISSARLRSNETITEPQLDFYVDPLESAFRYIDGATYAAERSRFLGRNHDPSNLGETIGSIVQQEVDAGRLRSEDQAEMIDVLRTRFTADMLTMNKHLRTFKQLVYLVSLGQFRSTLTQLTDIAFTTKEFGVIHTLGGIKDALHLTRKDRRIVMESIGIHDHGEEFKDIGRVAKATDSTLRATGFKMIDRFGKESRINAARRSMEAAALNTDGRAYKKMKRKYEDVLGTEAFEQTMTDLREGRPSENVKYLLFLDITQIQPLTMSQMPQKYLDSPNGRIFYTLKTFTLMQMDFVRRDMIRKLTTPGQRVEGLRNLGRYLLLFGLLGLGVDLLKALLRGEEVTADSIPDRSVDALLGAVGMNRYTVEQAKTDPAQAAMNYVAPPLSWLSHILQDTKHVRQVLTDEDKDFHGLRTPRNIPILGELFYFWAPWGRGYNMNRDEATAEYRKKLSELRDEAVRHLEAGDAVAARDLLNVYNTARRDAPQQADGRAIDGRRGPLTMENLRGDLRRDQRTADERTDPDAVRRRNERLTTY